MFQINFRSWVTSAHIMFEDNVLVVAANNARKYYFPAVDKKDMWVPHACTLEERLGSEFLGQRAVFGA